MNVLLDILDICEKGPKPDPETEVALKELRAKCQNIKDLEEKQAPASVIMDAMMS